MPRTVHSPAPNRSLPGSELFSKCVQPAFLSRSAGRRRALWSAKQARSFLKPGNLFVVPDNEAPGGERVKILDFGIAKFFGTGEGGSTAPGEEPRHLTTVGKLLGTPVYMSPEQCSGSDQINDRVDVYALGVILYQMIAGRLPFEAAAACVVMTKHLMEQPPPLGEHAPDASAEVLTLVHDMLHKNGQDRPSMAQVTVRLEELLGAQQGMRTGDWRSLHGQVYMRSRTRRPAVWLTAAFVLASSGLLGVGLYRRAHKPLPHPTTMAAAGSATTATATGPAVSVAKPAEPKASEPATPSTPAAPTVPAGTHVAVATTPKPAGDSADDSNRPRKRVPTRGPKKGGTQPGGSTTPTSSAPSGSGAPDIPVFR